MALQDITKEDLKELFEIAMDVAHVGYWEWDIQTNDVLWSRQKIEIYGEDSQNFEPTFEKFLAVIDEETKENVMAEIDAVLSKKKKYYDLQHKIKLKNGKIAWVHEKAFVVYAKDGTPLRMIGIVYDITEKMLTLQKLKTTQEITHYLREHDQLTGLYNKDALIQKLLTMTKEQKEFALLFMDVDNFRILNNTYGHLFGDIVLQSIAQKLQEKLTEFELFRYASDEFAVIIPFDADLEMIIELIHRSFAKPISIQDHLVKIDFSIGVASYPKDSHDIYELIKNANTAMQLAKGDLQKEYLLYESYMSEKIAKQHTLIESLKDAIQNESFIPYFQPKVDAKHRIIKGFEALVRWEHNSELIPPNLFLPTAAEYELLSDIDTIILKKSLKQLKKWHESGFKVFISVNFISEDFSNIEIYSILQEYHELLKYLIIEITEQEIMGLKDEDIQKLYEVKKLGTKLSLDDFGTGYSSLNYIHKFPLDELKIDKSFVDGVPGSKKDEALAKIIKSIADTFEFDCTVEGIEEQKQLDFFLNLGVNTIQGYYFSKPLKADDATNVLKNPSLILSK